MNAAIQIGDHPAEDTFVPLHKPPPAIKPALDTAFGWQDSPLSDLATPPRMMNTGKYEEPKLALVPRVGGLKIYVAGPMTGIKEFNFPAFHAATAMLRSHGHEVFNPAEKDMERHGIDISIGMTGDPEALRAKHGFSLREALRDDTHYICTEANAIAMLPGWEASKGACAEHALAFALGHQILYLGGFYG